MDRAEFMIEVLLRGGKRKEREENKIENKKKKKMKKMIATKIVMNQ